MAVPKKRVTAARQGRRRSHLALQAVGLTVCSNCGKAVRPHVMCAACGFYKGAKVKA